MRCGGQTRAICPACKSDHALDVRFCPGCGVDLSARPPGEGSSVLALFKGMRPPVIGLDASAVFMLISVFLPWLTAGASSHTAMVLPRQ